MTKQVDSTLRQEIMLQINQRLYDGGIITKDAYEVAKIKIIAIHT